MIVVFDIGNVLLRWDRRYLYRKVFDDEERMERFLATALAMDFVSHTDVSEADFRGADCNFVTFTGHVSLTKR